MTSVDRTPDDERLRNALARLRPDSFGHLVAFAALWRPGPLECGLFDEYVARRHGEKPADAGPFPRAVVAETYGLLVYREQVTAVASVMGGFGTHRATQCTDALASARMSDRERGGRELVAAAQARGHSRVDAERACALLAHFAIYTAPRDRCAVRARTLAERYRVG